MLRGSSRSRSFSCSHSVVGIMQNSICNLNVFILRYAGAIFIFTENEGFTRQEWEGEQWKERVVQAARQPKPGQAV